MDTVSDVNHKVMELWKNWEACLRLNNSELLMPLIYPTMERHGLLFIGMNPSFVLNAFEKGLKETSYRKTDVKKFFNWSNLNDFDTDKARNIGHIMREDYETYFGIFRTIAKDTLRDPKKWEHIDLFFNRATSQKDFEENILNRKDLAKFVDAQLELSAKLINYVCPKVIIIANARASKEFEEKLNAKFPLTWKEEYGYHMTTLQGRSIPVFLSSMLTGQRAMDVYSRRRLVWHIKQALLRQSKHK